MDAIEKEDWCKQAKDKIIKIAEQNVLTRCQEFEKCVNEVTTSIHERLRFPTHGYSMYRSPINTEIETRSYLKWIDNIKTPKPKTKGKEIRSFPDMLEQVQGRYNYLKSERFGDQLFPVLIQTCEEYANSLSNELLPQSSSEQKKAYRSILIKFYWARALGGIIDVFRQTKPTPLICRRSIQNKSRQLNQLLKKIVSENQMKKILKKKSMTSIPYDKFPTNAKMASDFVQFLGNEEVELYSQLYLNNFNTSDGSNNNKDINYPINSNYEHDNNSMTIFPSEDSKEIPPPIDENNNNNNKDDSDTENGDNHKEVNNLPHNSFTQPMKQNQGQRATTQDLRFNPITTLHRSSALGRLAELTRIMQNTATELQTLFEQVDTTSSSNFSTMLDQRHGFNTPFTANVGPSSMGPIVDALDQTLLNVKNFTASTSYGVNNFYINNDMNSGNRFSNNNVFYNDNQSEGTSSSGNVSFAQGIRNKNFNGPTRISDNVNNSDVISNNKNTTDNHEHYNISNGLNFESDPYFIENLANEFKRQCSGDWEENYINPFANGNMFGNNFDCFNNNINESNRYRSVTPLKLGANFDSIIPKKEKVTPLNELQNSEQTKAIPNQSKNEENNAKTNKNDENTQNVELIANELKTMQIF